MITTINEVLYINNNHRNKHENLYTFPQTLHYFGVKLTFAKIVLLEPATVGSKTLLSAAKIVILLTPRVAF